MLCPSQNDLQGIRVYTAGIWCISMEEGSGHCKENRDR